MMKMKLAIVRYVANLSPLERFGQKLNVIYGATRVRKKKQQRWKPAKKNLQQSVRIPLSAWFVGKC
jgi:hypothetical protein